MKANISFSDEYAVSEVVGAMLLILIAVVVFSAIYMYVFPLPFPPSEPNVQLRGYVTDDGIIVIEHIGGESLTHYRTDVKHVDGTPISTATYQDKGNPWEIGECDYPLADVYLLTENDMVRVTIYNIDEDGNEQPVFDGILTGKGGGTPPSLPSGPLMLISSLRTNTTDEDLICFNYTIEPDIDALTYIYNWSVDGSSIMNLLMPFDTDSPDTAKDYSGNENDGTFDEHTGPTWSSSGVVGGAYEFDGVDDYISLPYCFDDDSFIDEITVEAWIKTDVDSEVVASFDRNTLWELGITNGVVRWSTNANDGTTDTTGITNLADGSWHHVAATYDSTDGNCTIYVDGKQDKNENGHSPGEELGSGDTPTGFIGTSSGGDLPGAWEVLMYDDFESGWGNYTDGGRDCRLYTGGTYAHQGSNAADIQDNRGTSSSFYHTNGIDVHTPEYTSIKVDFWWMWRDDWEWGGWSNGEDWWIRYYDGNGWTTVFDMNYPSGYDEDTWYHQIVYINESDYNFPSNMKIRFQCDASTDWDDVYIDQVYVNGTTGGTSVSNFSGNIDEFHIYNRSLSAEQIYQNYLCTKDGHSDKSVIVSEETSLDNIWKCTVTPNDGSQDDVAVESNSLEIVNYDGGE